MTLRIHLFGTVHVAIERDGDSIAVSQLTPLAEAVLAFLLIERQHRHSRDALMGMFWGDTPRVRARCCLNSTLWRLRRALTNAAGTGDETPYLISSSTDVAFNGSSDFWLDTAEFETEINRVLAIPMERLAPDDIERLRSAHTLYTRDLLEGYYDDWALRERERLRRLYLNSLARLTDILTLRNRPDEAIQYAQTILEQDPLREEIHRKLMQLYHASGQRALALRQYDICRKLLADELGLAPMDETIAVQREIAAQSGASPMPQPAVCAASNMHWVPPDHPNDRQVLRDIQQAMSLVVESCKQLEQAMARFQSLLPQDLPLDQGR